MVRRCISIVGSGPSGFYTAHHLLQNSKVPLEVTIWERLPVPFGLSRYGVAPDHPNVKNCEQTFTKTAEEFSKSDSIHKFNFIGNCEVGKDIKLSSLLKSQDAVVLSYGCATDNKLGIPGEDNTNGVFTSRQFVNWYNGHPDFAHHPKFMNFDWKKVKNVGIIGNGNVALDLARLLLTCRIDKFWKTTDINPLALDKLRESPIESVKLIARRDFPHSKFTNKELREMWLLEEYGIKGIIKPEFFQPEAWDMKNQIRSFKRCVELCADFLKPVESRSKKYQTLPQPADGFKSSWELEYLKTPMSIEKDSTGLIKSLQVCKNDITPTGKPVPIPSDTIHYDCDLLITSLGYKGSPMAEFDQLDIKFDVSKIANKKGRVLNNEHEEIPRLYANGWIGRGASGVIMTTMTNAFSVADILLTDLNSIAPIENPHLPSLDNINYTTWEDAEKILAYEEKLGQQSSKPREKLLTTEEMLSVVR